MGSPTRRATYDDLAALPEHVVGELIDGELLAWPRPRWGHALATTKIGGALSNQFTGPPGDPDRPGGWWIVIEPELHLGDDVLVPDVAGWTRERLPRPAVNEVAQSIAPDWVCEVLSPSTAAVDRVRKLPIYARAGVRHVWLVDPVAQTLEVLRLQSGLWLVAAAHGGPEVARIEPFGAVDLTLAHWWGDA